MTFHSRGTAFKIFILVLITGIIGVAGIGIMQQRISKMNDSYEEMVSDYVDNCLKIDTVSSRMLSYHNILIEMVLRGTMTLHISKDRRSLTDARPRCRI